MKDAERLQQEYERFTASFLSPLLAGGTVVVGRPISPGALEHFALTRPSDSEVEDGILEALRASAWEIAPTADVAWPDRGTLALAIAAHDLLATTDPMIERAFARRARPVMLGWVDALVEAAGAPSSRAAALARHAILGPLPDVQRDDVVVRNWAYTYRFFGRPVPPRVVALPKLRFVRQERVRKSVVAIVAERPAEERVDVARRLRALISRSPITELLRSDLAPDLRFGVASLAVLSDARLRSGVARAIAVSGVAAAAPSIGAALRVLHGEARAPELLVPALAFVLDLHALEVLDARAQVTPAETLLARPDSALFAAILPAALSALGTLEPMLTLDPDDLGRLRSRGEVLSRGLERPIALLASDLVARAVAPEAQTVEVRT